MPNKNGAFLGFFRKVDSDQFAVEDVVVFVEVEWWLIMTRNFGELSSRAGFKHFYVHPPQIGRIDASNITLWIQVPPKKVL